LWRKKARREQHAHAAAEHRPFFKGKRLWPRARFARDLTGPQWAQRQRRNHCRKGNIDS